MGVCRFERPVLLPVVILLCTFATLKPSPKPLEHGTLSSGCTLSCHGSWIRTGADEFGCVHPRHILEWEWACVDGFAHVSKA